MNPAEAQTTSRSPPRPSGPDNYFSPQEEERAQEIRDLYERETRNPSKIVITPEMAELQQRLRDAPDLEQRLLEEARNNPQPDLLRSTSRSRSPPRPSGPDNYFSPQEEERAQEILDNAVNEGQVEGPVVKGNKFFSQMPQMSRFPQMNMSRFPQMNMSRFTQMPQFNTTQQANISKYNEIVRGHINQNNGYKIKLYTLPPLLFIEQGKFLETYYRENSWVYNYSLKQDGIVKKKMDVDDDGNIITLLVIEIRINYDDKKTIRTIEKEILNPDVYFKSINDITIARASLDSQFTFDKPKCVNWVCISAVSSELGVPGAVEEKERKEEEEPVTVPVTDEVKIGGANDEMTLNGEGFKEGSIVYDVRSGSILTIQEIIRDTSNEPDIFPKYIIKVRLLSDQEISQFNNKVFPFTDMTLTQANPENPQVYSTLIQNVTTLQKCIVYPGIDIKSTDNTITLLKKNGIIDKSFGPFETFFISKNLAIATNLINTPKVNPYNAFVWYDVQDKFKEPLKYLKNAIYHHASIKANGLLTGKITDETDLNAVAQHIIDQYNFIKTSDVFQFGYEIRNIKDVVTNTLYSNIHLICSMDHPDRFFNFIELIKKSIPDKTENKLGIKSTTEFISSKYYSYYNDGSNVRRKDYIRIIKGVDGNFYDDFIHAKVPDTENEHYFIGVILNRETIQPKSKNPQQDIYEYKIGDVVKLINIKENLQFYTVDKFIDGVKHIIDTDTIIGTIESIGIFKHASKPLTTNQPNVEKTIDEYCIRNIINNKQELGLLTPSLINVIIDEIKGEQDTGDYLENQTIFVIKYEIDGVTYRVIQYHRFIEPATPDELKNQTIKLELEGGKKKVKARAIVEQVQAPVEQVQAPAVAAPEVAPEVVEQVQAPTVEAPTVVEPEVAAPAVEAPAVEPEVEEVEEITNLEKSALDFLVAAAVPARNVKKTMTIGGAPNDVNIFPYKLIPYTKYPASKNYFVDDAFYEDQPQFKTSLVNTFRINPLNKEMYSLNTYNNNNLIQRGYTDILFNLDTDYTSPDFYDIVIVTNKPEFNAKDYFNNLNTKVKGILGNTETDDNVLSYKCIYFIYKKIWYKFTKITEETSVILANLGVAKPYYANNLQTYEFLFKFKLDNTRNQIQIGELIFFVDVLKDTEADKVKYAYLSKT